MATATPAAPGPPAAPHVSERDAREVAEAAREQEWARPSFVAGLFDGRLRLDLIHPYPGVDADEEVRARDFAARLVALLKETVDPEEVERTSKIPQAAIDGMKRIGAFGMKIPPEFGGLGFHQTSYNRAISMASVVESSVGVLLSAHQSIGVPQPLKLFGTPEQKQRYLPRLAKGEISAFALTEPGVGSDPARMSTTAELSADGTHYILNGEKLWCTNGTIADILIVMAKTGPRAITAFIVERAWAGIEVTHRCHFMGLKGIENAAMRFTNVKVPRENVLWGEGKGLKLALITLNTGRLTVPASSAAAAKLALQWSRTFAAERVQWGQAVGKHDAIAQKLGRMAALTFAMDAVADLAARLSDAGQTDIRLEAAMAKAWNTERGWEIIDDAMQIKGGRGYETSASLAARGDRAEPLERLMRDFRINRIFEGSTEIMALFIARESVDKHLKVAGALADPRAPLGAKVGALFRTALFYAAWYPTRWIGWGFWPRYGAFGKLARHLRFADRTSRRLARSLFHAIVRFGPGLEKRQAVLTRLVEIGAELFALTAACVKAHALATSRSPEERSEGVKAVDLADLAGRLARRRIAERFDRLFDNDDTATYRTAQRVLAGEFAWMEDIGR